MQKVLLRRIIRDFRQNLFRYIALAALIILGMYLIVSMVAAADTIIIGTEKNWEKNKIEDGQFSVFVPLSNQEEQEIRDEGVVLEKMFYMDFEMNDSSILRIFKNRTEINLVELDEGRLAEAEAEIVLEKRYCAEHGIALGNKIKIADNTYIVTGIGSVPDYDAVYRNLSDSTVDSKQFGIAFVEESEYENLKASGKSKETQAYNYAYRLKGNMIDAALKDMLKEFKVSGINNLTQFITADDNPRIGAGAEDQVINKAGGLIAGVIVMILFTYVISVFVIHGIDKESSVIGALYALGVRKKDLIMHYLMLPSIITFVAGVIGAFIGFSPIGVNYQMRDCYEYFSMPDFKVVYSGYLIVYSVVMPLIVAIIVNYAVIQKRLSKPVLGLIKNEQKSGKVYNLKLGKLGFVAKFQIRQMLREARSSFTVIFGMFISLLILMLGVNCYVMCKHISEDNKNDTKFEYMYTYKFPEEKVPEGGEACFAKTLKKEILGYNFDVTLLGIDKDNPYFDVSVEKGKNKVVISSAMAEKYQLHIGEQIVLSDEENEINYAFDIAGITQYSVGFYAFMDIDSMRELLGKDKEYYNVVFADQELPIETERLYATTSKEDINKSSDVFISMMIPMVTMMCGVSIIIFCVVMYLMMKVMVDRSSFNISLIKIFGYRNNEVRKLYLNGNFYLVVIGAAICIPLAKLIMDKMYPYMVSNIACGMNLKFDFSLYIIIWLAVIVCYLVINQILVGKLKKMVPAEVLKNRE